MLTQNELEPRKLRIIVGEGEGIIAREIVSMMDELGCEVAGKAATGADAFRLAGDRPVH